MSIPINIDTLLAGKVVELERIEFKKGWNPALFDTDEPRRSFFLVEIPIHPDFIVDTSEQDESQVRDQDNALINNEEEVIVHIRDQVGDQVGDQVTERIIQTLRFCFEPKTKREILGNLSLTNKSTNFKLNVLPAIETGLLTMTIPDKPNSRNQAYITTDKGKKILVKQ